MLLRLLVHPAAVMNHCKEDQYSQESGQDLVASNVEVGKRAVPC